MLHALSEKYICHKSIKTVIAYFILKTKKETFPLVFASSVYTSESFWKLEKHSP